MVAPLNIEIIAMNYYSKAILCNCLTPHFWTFVLVFLHFSLFSEGIQDAAPSSTDVVWLNVDDDNFGDFEAYGSAGTTSGLAVLVKEGECIYIGLSSGSANSVTTDFTDAYDFRIVDGTSTVVHGPFEVNQGNQNLSNWSDASGPTELSNPTGYEITRTEGGELVYKFCPDTPGEYWIEFDDGGGTQRIPLWDFAVGIPSPSNDGVEIPGRVYSQNWSFRTPPDGLDQGDYCNFFQRPFNGSLYSYTADGFVSKIDFMDSGIRGLTFNVAFDTDGPGTTGDLLERRKSIEDENATSSAAEHKIFLSPPDLTCFPDGECGEIIDVTLSCNADDFCLNFNISQPGDVQFVLDANDNGTFDMGSQDVIFL